MNIYDWVLVAVLLAALWFAIRAIKKGKGSCHGCSGGCASCPMHGKCHQQQTKE